MGRHDDGAVRLAQVLGITATLPTAEQLEQFAREEAAEKLEAEHERRAKRGRELGRQGAPAKLIRAVLRARVTGGPSSQGYEPVERRDGEPVTLAATEAVAKLSHALTATRNQIVVLSGGVGAGKTTAALAWLVTASGRPYWTSAAKLCRERFSRDAPWERARVGVIDDLGVEALDAYTSNRIDELVNHFAGAGRLVITTNLPPENIVDGEQVIQGFRERYGERMRSRIKEGGRFLVVKSGDLRTGAM